MYARVTVAPAHTPKIDETIKVMRDSILPMARKQKGFKGLFFLTNRMTSKHIVITMWNTEADLRAEESSGFYHEQVAKKAQLLAGPAIMEDYEVSVQG